MNDNRSQMNAQAGAVMPTASLSWMDKQFGAMSGCGLVAIIVIAPFIALVLGIVGLIACKEPRARERAKNMTIWGSVWFGINLLLLILMLSASPN